MYHAVHFAEIVTTHVNDTVRSCQAVFDFSLFILLQSSLILLYKFHSYVRHDLCIISRPY